MKEGRTTSATQRGGREETKFQKGQPRGRQTGGRDNVGKGPDTRVQKKKNVRNRRKRDNVWVVEHDQSFPSERRGKAKCQ